MTTLRLNGAPLSTLIACVRHALHLGRFEGPKRSASAEPEALVPATALSPVGGTGEVVHTPISPCSTLSFPEKKFAAEKVIQHAHVCPWLLSKYRREPNWVASGGDVAGWLVKGGRVLQVVYAA